MKQGQNTRQRLLVAARGLFAERGYHNATVRDIALRAGTNLASINYYFRSKDILYREVMRSTFDPSRMDNMEASARKRCEEGTPHERLRSFIQQLISLSADDRTSEEHRRLMAWEMLAPTGAIEAVDEWEISTHLERAEIVVRPFLPDSAPREEIVRTALWLIGQCLVFRKPALTTDQQDGRTATTAADGEQLTEFVMTHAMSGLNAG